MNGAGNIDRYQPSTNTWTTSFATLVERRFDHAAVALTLNSSSSNSTSSSTDSVVYVIGGTCDVFDNVYQAVGTVDIFYPKFVPPRVVRMNSTLNLARTGLCAVTDGTNVWAIGGSSEFGNIYKSITATVEVLNGTNGSGGNARGTWTTISPMKTSRYRPACAFVDGRVFVAGGAASQTTLSSNTIEYFIVSNNTWVLLSSSNSITTPRFGLAGVVWQSRFLVIGGSYTTSIDTIFPSNDSLTVVKGSSPNALAVGVKLHAAAVVDGVVFVAGGDSTTALQMAKSSTDVSQFSIVSNCTAVLHQFALVAVN